MHNPSPTPTRTRSTNTGDRLARGELCLVQFGQRRSYKLRSKAEWTAYEEAKTNGFLWAAGGEAKYWRLRNCFCTFVEARNWPYVVVVPRRRYCFIEMDLILVPPRPGDRWSSWQLNDASVARIDALLGEHTRPGSWRSAGGVYSYSNGIPIDVAPFVAQRMFQIGCEDLGVQHG